MLVYYLVLLAPSLIFATTSSPESFPLNDLLADFDTFLWNTTHNNSSSDDLVYLEKAGSFAITNDDMDSQMTDISSDVGDFIGLIPVEEVRAVIGNYYRNDPAVSEGLQYLKRSNFLKRLLGVCEIKVLVTYLNETGLDVERALNQLFNTIGDVEKIKPVPRNGIDEFPFSNDTELELSGGMHVMVDSVLEVIPQDEILNMFFEKMESSVPFVTFFNNIREPRFGTLVHNLEDSAGMKYLVYDLHNHGINMEKIVDSLKNYFFLGTFN